MTDAAIHCVSRDAFLIKGGLRGWFTLDPSIITLHPYIWLSWAEFVSWEFSNR